MRQVHGFGGAGAAASEVGLVIAGGLSLGVVTAEEAEGMLLSYIRHGDSGVVTPILDRIPALAAVEFEKHGFGLAQAHQDWFRHISVRDDHVDVDIDWAHVVDLSPLRGWADQDTRRAVMKAIEEVGRSFWCCSVAAKLFQTTYWWAAPSEIAFKAARKGVIDYDALWRQALRKCERETGDEDGDRGVQIMQIGGRKSFEQWMKKHIAVCWEHFAFLDAPPTGEVDPDRCAQARDWAARASALSREAIRNGRKRSACAERGEHRDSSEQVIFLTGSLQSDLLEEYFRSTDDDNGESLGFLFHLSAAGGGLLESFMGAQAGAFIFPKLQSLATAKRKGKAK